MLLFTGRKNWDEEEVKFSFDSALSIIGVPTKIQALFHAKVKHMDQEEV